MKAFEAYLERSAHDGGFDLLASRSLSREVNTAIPSQFAERQRLTVAANYFALACPILPVGLLGVFMLLGKLDCSSEEGDPKAVTAQDIARERTEHAQQMYLMAMKQKQEMEKRKTPLACSRPVEVLGRTDKTKKRKDAEWQLEGKHSQRINGPNLLSRTQNDASKLVKQKMALEEHLEKLSGEQDYHSYCRVSAQIELLDKALRKLGS